MNNLSFCLTQGTFPQLYWYGRGVVAFTKIDYVSRKHVVLPKKWYRAREREEPLGGLFSPKKLDLIVLLPSEKNPASSSSIESLPN